MGPTAPPLQAQRTELCFLFFEQAQAGADHIARGAVAASAYPILDEVREMIAERD
jgi:hypothetical protein